MPLGIALRLVIGELHVAEVLDRLADDPLVILGRHHVLDDAALCVLDAQQSVVVLQVALRRDQTQEHGRERAEVIGLVLELGHQGLEEIIGAPGDLQPFREQLEHGVALLQGQRIGDAAGDDPGGMDLLAAERFDDALADLAQPDAVLRQLGILTHDAEDVARDRVGVPAQQQIGRGQMEEGQRMRLGELRQIHDPPQLLAGRRDGHREQMVAGLIGRQQMADRADAAGARGERRHLAIGAALAEFLEATELGEMEARILDLAPVAELQRDAGVALDAGDWFDGDGAAHGFSPLWVAVERVDQAEESDPKLG